MQSDVFFKISKIIERDSKSSTYKFALLRGVIDIIQDNSPFISFSENRVFIPTGLMIEKWLLYYYPIINSPILIPQIHRNTNLAFEAEFKALVQMYGSRGGFSAFYNDLKHKGIPTELLDVFFTLVKKMRNTITRMPMKYIGRSISNEYYSIFKYENKAIRKGACLDIEHIILNCGMFSIPHEFYEAFKIIGSFINGQDSIIFKWAEFSVSASRQSLSTEQVLNKVLEGPITKRNIEESKKLYREILSQKGSVYCVWTGKKLTAYDIDHVIPFSIWRNNDLWNLLPSKSSVNNQKRDKIPSPETIERQKDRILEYWEIIFKNQKDRFRKEIQIALLGSNSFASWKEIGITQLKNSCTYLIENRGFEGWEA